jgi:hypothetical protein
MKLNSVYILIILFLASCAGTKTSKLITPAGDWDYLVSGTPDGDFKGVLKVAKAADLYTAKMISNNNEVIVENFSFAKETNRVAGQVPYNGFMVDMEATLAGDELAGSMSAGGMTFPFKATRKKQ